MSTGNPGLIGKAIRIKGELHGEEDLIIEGKVEGTIALKKNHLILERSAVIAAQRRGGEHHHQGADERQHQRVESGGDHRRRQGGRRYQGAPRRHGRRRAFRGAVDMDVKLPAGL